MSRSAVRTVTPFDVQLRGPVDDGDPTNGEFDRGPYSHGAWRRLRSSIAGRALTDSIPTHVTLVHPRTSALGPNAWLDLQHIDLLRTVEVASVAVTAFDGHRWATVSTHDLVDA